MADVGDPNPGKFSVEDFIAGCPVFIAARIAHPHGQHCEQREACLAPSLAAVPDQAIGVAWGRVPE